MLTTLTIAGHLVVTPIQAPPPVPLPSPAPQRACGPTLRVLQGLALRYDERIVAIGDLPSGGQVLLLVSPDRSTWTLLEVAGNGREVCVLGVGERWREAEPAAGIEQ